MCLLVAMLTCQQTKAQDLVYSEDFENGNGGWTAEGDYSGNYGMWEIADGTLHGYAYMATGPCKSYFVSPAFTLSASGNQVTFNQQGFYFNDFTQEGKLVIREKGGNWIEIEGIQYPELYEMANSGMLDIPAELNGKEVQVAFFYNLTSTASIGDWYIQDIQVYSKAGGEPDAPLLSFDKEEVTYDMSSSDPFEEPVFNNPTNLDEEFTSSNADVALVNDYGVVTIVGIGYTYITAFCGDVTASYKLTVVDSNVIYSATFSNEDGMCGFTEYSESMLSAWSLADGYVKADALDVVDVITDFYLISPEFKLDENGNTLSFEQTAMYFNDFCNEAQLLIREAGGEWYNVDVIEEPLIGMGFVRTSDIKIPSEFNGKTVQLAFLYTADGSEYDSGLWFVRNLNVKKVVPTGISEVSEEVMNNGKIYDIQGRELNKLQKGINIVNGKKIIVK